MTVTLEEIRALGLADEVERMRGHAPDPVMLAEEEKKRKNNEACKAYYWRNREEIIRRTVEYNRKHHDKRAQYQRNCRARKKAEALEQERKELRPNA